MSQANGAPPKQEYVIRVPKQSDHKRHSMIKFNGNLKVDTSQWARDGQLVMAREDNKGTVLANVPTQDFGEGSEYGRAAREEARRKKYGRQLRTYQLDNQPWQLSYVEEDGRERKFRSIRERGAGEHADYWVFLKVGDEFHAYKVDDWFQFLPAVTHKVLDIDQAEEQFQHRSRVMNQFALKAQIQKTLGTGDEDEALEKTKGLKIKDNFSDSDDDAEEKADNSDSEKQTTKKKLKKKKRGEGDEKKDKRVKVKDGDEVAKYESEDGEDEGREYDYMSDSGSDSDRDQEPMDEKIEKAMVGVGDEEGLKKMMDSDDEDEEEDEDPTRKLLGKDGNDEKRKNMDIEERDSSGSDTDDPDQKVDSVVFLPKKGSNGPKLKKVSQAVKAKQKGESGGKKRTAEEVAAGVTAAKKPKTEESAASSQQSQSVVTSDPDLLIEQTVRKYLERKPHTTKELVSKIKAKCCANMDKSDIVAKLAIALKKIGPHQFKQKVNRKDVLFFSLHNNMS